MKENQKKKLLRQTMSLRKNAQKVQRGDERMQSCVSGEKVGIWEATCVYRH